MSNEGSKVELGERLLSTSISGDVKIVKELIDEDVNVNYMWGEPLINASGSDNFEVVKLLVENGADVHAGDDAPVYLAFIHGNERIVLYLLQNGVSVEKMKRVTGWKAGEHENCEDYEAVKEILIKVSNFYLKKRYLSDKPSII